MARLRPGGFPIIRPPWPSSARAIDWANVPAALLLAASSSHAEQGRILIGLAVVLVGAKLFGALVERVGQPAVLGELLFGIVLGNLALLGRPSVASLETSETFAILAELGAILLLLEVGLESTPRDMMAVGVPATLVAVVGIVAPMALGFLVGELMLPREPWMTHAFLGAMLAATSMGITARVLQEAKATKTASARIILGAAVIDDVLGLVVLAIVAGVIQAASAGTTLALSGIAVILLKALGFLVGAILLGSFASPRIFRHALALRSTGVVQALALGLCFALAWLASEAGLAPIVGAFAAGLVMEDVHFGDHLKRGERPLHESLRALTGLLVPVFFVRMGMIVHVGSFVKPGVISLAVLITVAAMVGSGRVASSPPAGSHGRPSAWE
jgi:Na+:H+ antiporter